MTAEQVLQEGRKPLARPYRRLTGEAMADAVVARETRGVRPDDAATP